MQTVHDVPALRAATSALRKGGARLALVPTMGALHDGHMSLVEEAKRHADHVAVSIFVNPRQFGPNEDFDAYPRPAEKDMALLVKHGVSLLWMPGVSAMYPAGYATNVSVAGLGDGLCGAARPGHFDGVATVVSKLFNQVRPDVALFGEKDWQQLAIIRRMNADLDIGVEVVGVPTVREADGLALSSRNAYLTADERAAAAALPKAMAAAKAEIEACGAVEEALEAVRAKLVAAGFQQPDYVALCGAEDLQDMAILDRPARLLVAARLGKARLIDNWGVYPPSR
jgi:pantoate--beta-alanine ligase